MPLQLYNTLSRKVEPFIPRDSGKATMYTCGPTVYARAHIGNFRTFLVSDLLRRYLLWEFRCQIGIVAGKWLLRSQPALRRQRIAAYRQVLRSGVR